MEEKFFSLFKNKQQLWTTVIVYIVVAIITLIIIWWPKSKNVGEAKKLDLSTRQSQIVQSYNNKINQMFKDKDIETIKNLIANDYIEYSGKTKDEIVNELQNQGLLADNVKVEKATIYTDDTVYVYSLTVTNGMNSRVVNLIETYPYQYKMAFDDFYTYNNYSTTISNSGLEFTIDSVYRNLGYYKVNMRIENKNDVYARFNFNNIDCVQAVLEDGTRYPITNLISDEAYTNVEPNMTISKEFIFQIPAQLQEGIEYIVFNNVSIKFSESSIKVSI